MEPLFTRFTRDHGVSGRVTFQSGGFDYTGADCQVWMREAGFRKTCVGHLVGPDSMVVGIK